MEASPVSDDGSQGEANAAEARSGRKDDSMNMRIVS
jgi:hypothetical protein